MARKRSKRPIKCHVGQQRYTVVRVDGSNSDTHAGRSFESAMSSAQPDRGARVEVFRTCARDAGAARLMMGPAVRVKAFRYKGR